jgi:preprotein translocase subunit YajC
VFLLAQAAEQSSPFGSFGLLVPAALFFVIFYFIVMRPQAKQQGDLKAMRDKLAKGDEVITTGGFIGKVDKVADSIVFLEVANNVKIRVLKDQISGMFKTPEPAPAAAEEKKG